MFRKFFSWFMDNSLLTVPALLMLLLVCGAESMFGASRLTIAITAGVVIGAAGLLLWWGNGKRMIGG